MDPTLRDRMREMAAHDMLRHEAYMHLPFEVWPDEALLSFLANTAWESAFTGRQPTGAELRAIIAEAIGPCHVTPEAKDEDEQ